MANAIKWIARRAKQLKRSRPNKHKKYTGYVKDAAAEYRKKSKPRRKSVSKKSRPKKSRPTKKRVAMRRKKVSGTIGSMTVAQHVSSAKNLIAQKIANLELRKFTSTTKAEKRKISKAIRELKRSYSKLKN